MVIDWGGVSRAPHWP